MKQSKYPLHPEPLYVKITRAEVDSLKASAAELSKTKTELAKANKLIKELKKMRTKAQKGDTIRIIEMVGEPRYSGKIGTVEHIDDIGQIHGTWGGCAIQLERDTYEILQHA